MWSAGVILYILLCGYMPFQGFHLDEIFHKIKKGQLNFEYEEFKHVSSEGIDLIQKLIVLDPIMRYSAHEALEHPWFKKFAKPQGEHCQEFEKNLVRRLQKYRGVSHLKRAAFNILVKMASEEHTSQIAESFKQMDRDGTGMISIEEL